jgi:anti-sigma regulatory factor (Ser/Thr protein kinase)
VTDEISLPADPLSPRAARDFVAVRLGEWGVDRTTQETARLLTSELATNAVVHARSPFQVTIGQRNGAVRISIHDTAVALPRLRADPGPGGLGLRLLAQLADRWGVEPAAGDGKDVWFEVDRRPD